MVAPARDARAEPPLSTGVNFPEIGGKNLAGGDVVIRADGKTPRVFVMSFTMAASKPAAAWLEGCRTAGGIIGGGAEPRAAAPAASPGPRPVVCYDVRLMDGIPRVLRGFLEGRARKHTAAKDLVNTVFVYRHEELWRDRLMVLDDFKDQPFVVFVDAQGRVSSLLQGAWDAGRFSTERARIVTP
jgi:hypothetical protein